MKNAIAILLALAIVGTTSEANARWRLFGRSTVNVMANAGNKAHVQAWSTAIQADAQAACQQKANIMASRGVLSCGSSAASRESVAARPRIAQLSGHAHWRCVC